MAANDGFLPEEQKEVMNSAPGSSKSLSSSPKKLSTLLDDHLDKCGGVNGGGNAHSGKLDKGVEEGVGSKGATERPLDTDCDVHLDHKYDSDEEPYKLVGKDVIDPVNDYKNAVVSIIDEYFSTGAVDVAAYNLRELGSSEYHPYFIKNLVSVAMNRHDKEKEMASVLLSTLHVDVIAPAQISQGFILLLESADDLSVDNPEAVNVLALFVALAVVDGILPPVFVTRVAKILPEYSKGRLAIKAAVNSYLSDPHHEELIERKWSGGTHLTVEEIKKKITDILREYVENGDTLKACRSVRELQVPFFHYKVVKRAVVVAMKTQSTEPLIIKLLQAASKEGLISINQMMKGFYQVEASLDDISLDIPLARSLFQSLIARAILEGWLDPSFSKSTSKGDVGPRQDNEKLKWYKKEVVHIIHEYFLSDDIPELIHSLIDLEAPEFNPNFLKRLITLAMDRKNREKEMASVLLSGLHTQVFSTEDTVNGFVLLLESTEDMSLDILNASNELALFLARAMIDDVLAPLNLDEIASKLPPNCHGIECVHMARSLVFSRHAGERILRCWGGGSGRAVEDAKHKVLKLLEEYERGGTVKEACQCIRDLGMPFFNHEVVKRALVMAMEKKNDRMLDLLQECFAVGLITMNQMSIGFGRVKDELDDLVLDIPNAMDKFESYVENAREKGWILPSFDTYGVDVSLVSTNS
ncbi:MA3 DOMAIN-CONTAINING TRANSLATION REGULATORY FACTOR 4-like [Silene latifolia]|uniref:MA3 DOMAIN-CONTAINING TRANSLATION REGULATORY FACTOR 4-like n=1 Tax=Silene latifolia TaxID=37657 RepID=UPI003D77AE6E